MRSIKSLLTSLRQSVKRSEVLNGDGAFEFISLPEIQLLIDKAAQRYYRTDNEAVIMEDSVYDALIEYLRVKSPDDERLTRVGIPYSVEELRDKVKHPIPMGSLDNTDDGILGLNKWYQSVCDKLGVDQVDVCASLKIDGASIRLAYKNGRLIEAASRGNGEVGENVTANVANFQHVPTVLEKEISLDIRGEAILHTKDYQDVRSNDAGIPFEDIPEAERSNPRNIGNGMIGRDSGVGSELLRFTAFNVESGPDTNFTTESEKFEYLRDFGFLPVPHRMCASVEDIKTFYASIVDGRDNLPFEIDGVVVTLEKIDQQNEFVTDDVKTRLRPKYARAIKFPHKSNTTTVEGVTISVGHTGAIIPTAVLKEVRIGGINNTSVLLNNWDEIGRLGVAIGDKVEVILAGDIIPKIIRVVKTSPDRVAIAEPTACPSCGEALTRMRRGKAGAITYCSGSNCPEVELQKIDHWIGTSKKGIGILEIGDTILRTLWDEEVVKDAADLYLMKVEQIENLVMEGGGRIGKSRATKIINNINAKKVLPLPVFLGALGIELLGRRRAILMQDLAGGKLDTLDNWLDDANLASIKAKGLGPAIKAAVRYGMDENRDLIEKLLKCGVSIEVPESVDEDTEAGLMAGVSFCFTGTRECIEQVQEQGAEIKNSVAKSKPSPDYLVQNDPLSQTNKTKNADSNGHTQVISLDFLKKVLAGTASLL